jgi:hypothetical protein
MMNAFVGQDHYWGQEPHRSVLPKLLHDVAMDSLYKSKLAVAGLVATVGLMPDETLNITLSGSPAVPAWTTRALAWISVRVEGPPGEGSVLHDFSSPSLARTRVPRWLLENV